MMTRYTLNVIGTSGPNIGSPGVIQRKGRIKLVKWQLAQTVAGGNPSSGLLVQLATVSQFQTPASNGTNPNVIDTQVVVAGLPAAAPVTAMAGGFQLMPLDFPVDQYVQLFVNADEIGFDGPGTVAGTIDIFVDE